MSENGVAKRPMPIEEHARPLVLHIITGLGTGGAETALLRLSSHASRYRHAVISLIDYGTIGPRLEAAGVPVDALGIHRPLGLLRGPWRLREIVRRTRPAIVQGWMTHGNLVATLASRLARAPVIWSVRQSLPDFKYEKATTVAALWASARVAGRADRIVYNSSEGARDHERLGYPVSNGCRIPNGFDTNLFAPSAERRRRMREELGVDDETLLIGLIGRLHVQKNQAGFLAAAAAVLGRTNRKLRFLLAGSGTGPDNPALRRLVPNTATADATFFLGDRCDIPDVTNALDLAVNCSFGEGFPNALGEAMACAVPSIVTDVGDSAWVVGDGGWVIPADDQKALEDALCTAIALPREERMALGAAARRRVVESFSLSSVVGQYEHLYADLIERGRDDGARYARRDEPRG